MSVVVVCLIAALFGFAGSMPLAGPVAVLVVSRGALKEYTAAFRIGLGAAVAEGVYAFLAFWGFATFLARYPAVLPISHGQLCFFTNIKKFLILYFYSFNFKSFKCRSKNCLC